VRLISVGSLVSPKGHATLIQVCARLRNVARGDRRALLMYAMRGMSYPEIAAALGISVAAVKSRIFRAREALAAGMSAPRSGAHS